MNKKYFLVVKDNLVINTIVVLEGSNFNFIEPGLEYIEYSKDVGSPGIGWSYDGVTFSPPAPISTEE